ncbi:amidase domain-containing protein [Streptomyces subrutilus]|uniref:amidase domain-containing protein n=1 Tax=Streptomyces subrutilus TaxID=36818 RepID=UPI00340A7FD3
MFQEISCEKAGFRSWYAVTRSLLLDRQADGPSGNRPGTHCTRPLVRQPVPRTRSGSATTASAWRTLPGPAPARPRTSWTSWKKNSYTWSAAQNLFVHMLSYRQPGYVNQSYNLRPGDILFFRFKGDSMYNHAAVVTGHSRGVVLIAQHGYGDHSDLAAVISRNKSTSKPIVARHSPAVEPLVKSRRALRAGMVSALALVVLTGCSADYDADDVQYAGDYSSHPPLAVVGYPSTKTLGITQQVVWRIADGRAEELASLGDPDHDKAATRRTAENWIAAFGRGARGKVTAEFYDEGSYRQMVVLYLHDTGQIKAINVRPVSDDHKDVYRVSMAEPDPGEATAVQPWLPKTPGELGSKTVR